MFARRLFGIGLAITASSTLSAEVLREQTIELKRGWNAVHLEVEPLATNPGEVLADLPIDIAARYFRLQGSVEFISDPTEQSWQEEGWGVWYAPNRPDAFLTSLHAIQGNQSYLIHATSDHQWKLTGKVRYARTKWRNDSYNLVGFSVDSASPPSFQTFFAGANGKIGTKIYRLQNDRWVKVTNPAGVQMKSGEAFWTYCEGNTDFQGPLDLQIPATGELNFGKVSSKLSLQWRTAAEANITVTSVESKGASAPLPLHYVERNLETLTDSFPVLSTKTSEGARGGSLAIQMRRDEMTADTQVTLLKITDGAGAVAWIPVSASQPDH